MFQELLTRRLYIMEQLELKVRNPHTVNRVAIIDELTEQLIELNNQLTETAEGCEEDEYELLEDNERITCREKCLMEYLKGWLEGRRFQLTQNQ